MRKLTLILLSCTLVLLAGYSGYRGYKVWKQHRMMNLARAYVQKGDLRNTTLCLAQVLKLNPVNLEACRMIAAIAEAEYSPAAVLWRSRVVESNPRSTGDRLALAETALLFKEYAVATNAMGGVDAAGKKTAAYHNLAGAIDIAMNHPSGAVEHFQEAIRLEPGNLAPQLNLAVIRLYSTNQLDAEEARISLKRIVANPTNATLRCSALRQLIDDSLRSKQFATALSLSTDLLKQPNSEFKDKLARLSILRGTTNAEYKPTLTLYQAEAASNRTNLIFFSDWEKDWIKAELVQLPSDRQPQRLRQLMGEILPWYQGLAPEIRTNQPAALLIADFQTKWCGNPREWSAFQTNLTRQSWGVIDYLRHAYVARALRGQNLEAAAKSEWDIAIKEVNDKKPAEQKVSIGQLYTLSVDWKWDNESESLLWVLVRQFPEEKRAPMLLASRLFDSGRTRPLMSLFSQQLKRSPNDLSARNNLAQTALLLDAQEMKPHDLAREVYQKAPTNAAFASTYAFSLYLQKKNAESLNVFAKMDPKSLEDPSIAGYYGLTLKATGNATKAQKYLAAGLKAPLLPEERKLMEKAM